MAILFAGGELEDFALTGAGAVSTTSSHFRSDYARVAAEVSGGPWLSSYLQGSFTASGTVGLTARVFTGNSLTAGLPWLWLSTGGIARLRLRNTSASPSTITLETWNGSAAATLATGSGTLAITTVYRIDILVSYGASGRFRLWVNGVPHIDYSGDLTAGTGSTTLDAVNLGAFWSTVTAGGGRWSEVIVTDEDPRPLSLKTLAPNAAGDTNAWTGAYTDIDETTASDVDVVSSGTAGQVMNMECTGMPAGSSGLSVRAVKVVASALRGASGPSKLALGVKSGTTEGWSADIPLDTGYTAVSNTWTVNPATGAAFTAAELEALKIALKSVA